MKHLQRIDEFLSSPYNWDWTRCTGNEWVAEFTTEDDKFWVEFTKEGAFEPYDLVFSSQRKNFHRADMKGPASAMRILTTVFLDIMPAFLESNPGETVKFYGAQGAHDDTVKADSYMFTPKPDFQGETKRDRVYKMLMRQLPDDLKWESHGRVIHVSYRRVPHMHESLKDEFNLDEMFDVLNKKLFDGELKKIPLVWKTMRGSGGHLKSHRIGKYGKETPDYIAISDFYKKSEQQLLDTLAHEMVHLWIVQNEIRDDSYHGYRFVQKMKEINAKGIVKIDLKDDVSDIEVANDKELSKPVVVFYQEDHTLKKKLISLITKEAFTAEAKEKIMDAIVSTSKYSKRDFTVKFFESTDPDLRKFSVTRKFKNAHTMKYYTYTEVKPSGSVETIEVKDGKVI